MHFITLRLESEPTADVTVRFTVLQDAEGAYQYANLRPIPDTLTFEPADFGTPESVAFVIQDDGTYYGDVQFDVQVSFTSLDVQYANLVPPPLVVTALEGDPLSPVGSWRTARAGRLSGGAGRYPADAPHDSGAVRGAAVQHSAHGHAVEGGDDRTHVRARHETARRLQPAVAHVPAGIAGAGAFHASIPSNRRLGITTSPSGTS